MSKFLGWLKENWFKLTVLIIFVSFSIFGTFLFLSYLTHQLEVESDAKRFREEQADKAYKASRRKDCFEIYNKEKDNWNNTAGNEYDERTDTCYVLYRSAEQWKNVDCNEFLSASSSFFGSVESRFRDYSDCSNKQFRKSF